MEFHLSPDIAKRVVNLIYDISGYLVVVENSNGEIAASTDISKLGKDNDYSSRQYKFNRGEKLVNKPDNGNSEKAITIMGKTVGKIIIWGPAKIAGVLVILASEFITALMQEKTYQLALDNRIDEYETIFNLVPAQIWYKNTKNRFLRVNKQVEKDLGIPVQSFEGQCAEDLFPEYADQYYQDDLEVIHSGKPKVGIVEQVKGANGESRWVNTNKVPTIDPNGNVTGIVALVLDITESIKADTQLRIWAKIFESSGEAISITDRDNRFVVVNQAFCNATGYSYDEIIGQPPSMLKSGRHDEMFYQNMWAAINQTGSWEGEIWEKRKDGVIYLKWLKINQIRDDEGNLTNYLATFIDISERKAAEERIEYLDRHDALTGLPNRKVLRERIESELEKARYTGNRLGILSLDLDRFKNINDSLGHQIGDEVLREIGRRLELCCPNMAARFGGDAFVMLVPGVSQKDEILDRIHDVLSAIAEPLHYEELELMVTGCIGVSVFPDDGDTSEVLIRNADAALHQAKGGQTSYQFFTAIMNNDAAERLILETGLRRALDRNEFVLFYQPKLNSKTEEVMGVEALIRWNHPSKGLISPLNFIPIAEETGLIIPIGQWVLKEACRQHKEWISQGISPLPISVNISAIQFRDKDFLQMLNDIVNECGIEQRYLEMEVTESVLMRRPEFVIKQLESIKAMGLSLSLDDFGTGFSSLSYLRYFPLDSIKIDRSFVNGLVKDSVDKAIVETIIALGKSLKIKTIAEGVETKQELECLRRLQCDEIQGYYFSKPLSSQELIEWLRVRPFDA